MKHIQLLFGFLQLVLQPGHLLLVGGLALLELDLEECQLFHGFFHALLVLLEHGIGGPVFAFQCFVDVLEVHDFAIEIFKFAFKLVPLSFDELQLFLETDGLVFPFFLHRNRNTFKESSSSCSTTFLALISSFSFSIYSIMRADYSEHYGCVTLVGKELLIELIEFHRFLLIELLVVCHCSINVF